jgi:serine/threonine protein kinase
LTIYEIGEADGRHFIASEFVGGETLHARLKRKEKLTGAEIFEIARQIAAALNAAHLAGIVHRDIKPENIMLRNDGLVKVLDFGLAKLTEKKERRDPEHDLVSTDPGMVMGTVAYMSPEQVRGNKTDARSDIWSFGVVLCEMLTGRLPFEGDTTSDRIAAILTTEPILLAPEAKEQGQKGSGIRRMIAGMLRKDPAERYRSATEVAEDLEKLRRGDEELISAPDLHFSTDPGRNRDTDSDLVSRTGGPSQSDANRIDEKQAGRKYGPILAFVAVPLFLLAAAGITYIYFYGSDKFSPREPIKIARIFDTGKTISAAISPDGKFVVHALTDGGQQSLWIKNIATNSTVQLVPPVTTGFSDLTFSRDGNQIYYVRSDPDFTGALRNSGLYRIPVLGGKSQKILDNVHSRISFSPDGRQFSFVRNPSDEEAEVIIADADSGREEQLAMRRRDEIFGNSASWSPDGKLIAVPVTVKGKEGFMNIALIPVSGGGIRLLSPQKWRLILETIWAPDGSGLFATAMGETGEGLDQIWFFPLAGGEARLITTDLNQYSGISLTENGDRLVTVQWQNRQNIWMVPKGRSEEARILTSNIHGQYRFIALAPDGRIVFPSNENAGDGRDIWIMDTDGSNARQLTSNAGGNILPCVTRDGRYILFASNRPDSKAYHIWRMNIDGTDPIQLTHGRAERGPRCPPDPRTVYYNSGGPGDGMQKSRLWKTTIGGEAAVQLTDYPVSWSDVSPDGKFIALNFRERKGAPLELGIIPVTGGKPVKTFEMKQNSRIRWKPDGRAITYIRTENGVSNIWEQPVGGGTPRQLTNFTAELILGFDWSDEGNLVCSRGYEVRDPVIISNLK